MNALVSVRNNFNGFQGQTPEKRVEAARQVASNAQAKAMGAAKAAMKAAGVKAADAEGEEETSRVDQELGRDAFLGLLVMQMQNQDPLDPVDNSQMIAQLAQFSALEQMNNLNESFEGFSEDFNQLSFITAGNLVGKTVQGVDGDGVVREGKVEKAVFDRGSIFLYVDGRRLALADVRNVA